MKERKMKKIFFVVALCVMTSISFARDTMATLITLQPGSEGKDTYLHSDRPNDSHGDGVVTQAGDETSSPNNIGRSLFEFDLSPVVGSSFINSATLSLYANWKTTTDPVMEVHQITSSWTEDVSWNTQPTVNLAIESSALITSTGWQSWDITSLTQNWVDGTTNNYGIELYSQIGIITIYSSDYTMAALRPKLEIDYAASAPVPEPATVTLLGIGLVGLAGGAVRRRLKKSKEDK